MTRRDSPPPALMLLGPTASGKSALSMAIAREWPVEIISVDSALVYRGMDIGTAKPDAHDRARVAHHLIDILDPTQPYSAARFVEDASRLCAQISARGRIPLLVGGTMLYAKALREGLDPLPAADPLLRARLEAQAAELGWPALHARLAERDPHSAARIEPGDAQRIQRALEVIELTGMPMSRLHSGTASRPGGHDMLLLSLEPSDRALLHQRIAQRLHAMIAAGLIDELERLRHRPGITAGLPSMRAVGYRQFWEFLESDPVLSPAQRRDPLEPALAQPIERAIAATRRLAKRQLTWLRSMPERLSLDCLSPQLESQALTLIAQHLGAPEGRQPQPWAIGLSVNR